MRIIFRKALPFLLLLALFSPASASKSMLDSFFAEVNTLQANFEQRVVDETGMMLEISNGQLYLSRPGKFRWDYRSTDLATDQSNDPGMLLGAQIIADGESIVIYDPDLEQATKRSMQDALDQVPSLLLVQSATSNLQEHFTVIDIGLTDGLSWVSMKPLGEEAAYQHLMIGFLHGQLNMIVLLDGLGNETRLSLSSVKSNIDLPAQIFDFQVPDGADLLIQ
jgi:outer membrane lipoprotein carrier protein